MNGFSSLGIDLTSLVLYLVNFGLLYLVVSKLISKPLVKIINRRKEIIKENLSEAEKIKQEMIKEKQDFDELKRKMKEEMDLEMRNFRNALEKRAAQSEAEFLKRREVLFEEANSEIKTKKNRIIQELHEEILNTINIVVSEVLKGKVSEGAVRKSVSEVWAKYLGK
jgi:F-type H+-transporting ATPase subunit b